MGTRIAVFSGRGPVTLRDGQVFDAVAGSTRLHCLRRAMSVTFLPELYARALRLSTAIACGRGQPGFFPSTKALSAATSRTAISA